MLKYWQGGCLQHMNLEGNTVQPHNRSRRLRTNLWGECATWPMVISLSSNEVSTGWFGSWWELSIWITKGDLLAVSLQGEERDIISFLSVLRREIISSWDLYPHDAITSQRPPSSNTIIWWVRASPYEYREDTIQFTASTILYLILNMLNKYT